MPSASRSSRGSTSSSRVPRPAAGPPARRRRSRWCRPSRGRSASSRSGVQGRDRQPKHRPPVQALLEPRRLGGGDEHAAQGVEVGEAAAVGGHDQQAQRTGRPGLPLRHPPVLREQPGLGDALHPAAPVQGPSRREHPRPAQVQGRPPARQVGRDAKGAVQAPGGREGEQADEGPDRPAEPDQLRVGRDAGRAGAGLVAVAAGVAARCVSAAGRRCGGCDAVRKYHGLKAVRLFF
mmetsp:Transcript_30701/g.70163  ORF Transcript_30701/g.70163 Transcript_30701/m.70163 type:complete len:235 (+) Transcript_30701:455-1159(+)